MQHMYLRILERSLTGRLDHGVICDAQIQYHMLHEQVLEYLGKISLEESGYYRQVLDITWKMMAEMEQILFLVNIDRRGVLTGRDNGELHLLYRLCPEPDSAASSYTSGKTCKKDQRNALPEMGGQRLGTFLSDDQICKEPFQPVPHGQQAQGWKESPLKIYFSVV